MSVEGASNWRMWVEILLLLLLLGVIIYRWITKSFDKWEKIGLPHDKPRFPNGTHNLMDGKKSVHTFAFEDYNKFKIEQGVKVHGWFVLGKPALSINDPDLIKQITVKDFNHFMDRNEANIGRNFKLGGKLDKVRHCTD